MPWARDRATAFPNVLVVITQGLKTVARLAQMHSMGSDIAHLENPLLAEGTLHRQVPLLRAGHNKVPRHLQPKNVRGQQRSRASTSGCWSVHSVLRGIGCGIPARIDKPGEYRQARNKSGIERSGFGQAVWIGIRTAT